MEIPVYGLSGVEEYAEMQNVVEGLSGFIKQIRSNVKRRNPGRSFNKYANKIKNVAYRKAVTDKHVERLNGLTGIFNTSAAKVANGTATSKDVADFKKAHILLTLEDTDYDAFRLASIYMPHVIDIDEDGGYIFPTQELAEVAAAGEEEFIDYVSSPNATELGKLKIFKKIGNAVKNAAKSVAKATKTVVKATGNAVKTAAKATANVTKAAVKATGNAVKTAAKATVNATKATANLVKAGAQAATGHGAAAKATLQKAGQQAKAATVTATKDLVKNTIVKPTVTAAKTTVTATKNLVKDTVKPIIKDAVVAPIVTAAKDTAAITKAAVQDTFNIMKQTVKIAGKVFKVLFIKINPITVLIRSSLRAACALNLFGVATKMGVGLMTQANAEKAGYTKAAWESARKGVERFKKLFKKMGGDPSKLEKSIKSGANKKPLFKKDIRPQQKINFAKGDDGETTLADPGTIAAIVAACGTILATVLSWVANVIMQKKQEKAQEKQNAYEKEMQEKAAEEAEKQRQFVAEESEKNRQLELATMAVSAQQDEEKKKSNKKLLLILGGLAVGGGLLYAMSKGKKKGKRRR